MSRGSYGRGVVRIVPAPAASQPVVVRAVTVPLPSRADWWRLNMSGTVRRAVRPGNPVVWTSPHGTSVRVRLLGRARTSRLSGPPLIPSRYVRDTGPGCVTG